jgi:hypothetical protein
MISPSNLFWTFDAIPQRHQVPVIISEYQQMGKEEKQQKERIEHLASENWTAFPVRLGITSPCRSESSSEHLPAFRIIQENISRENICRLDV